MFSFAYFSLPFVLCVNNSLYSPNQISVFMLSLAYFTVYVFLRISRFPYSPKNTSFSRFLQQSPGSMLSLAYIGLHFVKGIFPFTEGHCYTSLSRLSVVYSISRFVLGMLQTPICPKHASVSRFPQHSSDSSLSKALFSLQVVQSILYSPGFLYNISVARFFLTFFSLQFVEWVNQFRGYLQHSSILWLFFVYFTPQIVLSIIMSPVCPLDISLSF